MTFRSWVVDLEAFGLALAGAVGYWICFLYQIQYYFTGKSILKFTRFSIADLREIIVIVFPGALDSLYMTVRRLVLNALMLAYVGNAGMSAYAAADTLLSIFWAVPAGLQTVGRMLMSVAAGEEDRQSLKDIIGIMVSKYLIIVTVMAALIIVMAVPFTSLYYRDPSDPVFQMTVAGIRLLLMTMPLGLLCMTWSLYAQIMKKQVLIHSLSLIDGALAVCVSAAILVPRYGMKRIYLAAIANGIITYIYPLLYSLIVNRGMPKTTDQFLMIPKTFGVPEEERLDVSIESREEAVFISRKIQRFCLERDIDRRCSYLSALCMEEMTISIIDNGFSRDGKPHSMDVRVIHSDDTIILRIKDNCAPLNPSKLADFVSDFIIAKNIGVRIVYPIAREISYQNMLGINVLTIRI